MASKMAERDWATRYVFGAIVPALRASARFARRKPLGAIGAIILVVLVSVAIVAPLLAPQDPQALHLKNRFAPPGTKTADTGETLLLGGDQLGRDILSRLIHGARISLRVSLISVGIGVTIGALIGLIGAYLGGTVDLVLQRIIDAFMALPSLIFALAMIAFLGSSLNNIILVISITMIPGPARVIRSEALAVKETVYVDAARAIGSSDWRIIFRQVLPNCMAPYIVLATASLALAIILEASLSFLGFGAPPQVSSWGGMLSTAGQHYAKVAPWMLLFPGLAISIVVFGVNLFGDALRDVLDPRLRGT